MKSISFAEFTLSNAEGLRMTARRAVNQSRDSNGASPKPGSIDQRLVDACLHARLGWKN